MLPGTVTFSFIHPGSYAACFAESKLDLFMFDAVGRQRLVSHRFGQLGKECGSGGIVAGRNHLVKVFLDEAESEWLLMVDADMGFASSMLEDLLEAADPVDRPVVGGLCFAHKNDGKASHGGVRFRCQPTLYDFVDLGDRVGFVPRFDYLRDELSVVSATGGACMLMHRTALEKVRARYGGRWFDTIEHPKGPTTFSEDLSFCVRLAGVGVPLHVDTRVKLTHAKGGVFLDEEFFDAQQAARAAAGTTEEVAA